MRIAGTFLLCAMAALASEEGGHAGPGIGWKWANFVLLAIGLGYLISKHAGPWFQSRTAEIQTGLREARKLREDSEARVAEMERRVASLEADVQKMKEEAKREITAAGERIQSETERAIAKIQSSAENEIANAAKTASRELKAYSADLAVQLAAAQLRERMTPAAQEALAAGFVSQLAGSAEGRRN